MTADPQREFVDANVLVYAFDASAVAKQEAARRLLEKLWESRAGCLSVQVLQEFFVTVTKKVAEPLPVEEPRRAFGNLRPGGFSRLTPTMSSRPSVARRGKDRVLGRDDCAPR